MESNPRLATRWLMPVLLPVAVMAMLPIVLAIGFLFYLRAAAFAIVDVANTLLGRTPAPTPTPEPLQEPHFRMLMRHKARHE